MKEINSKYGFVGKNDNVYLTKCPKCLLENYAMNVSSGICTWCGYDGNKDSESLLKYFEYKG
jgi:ribosomal protein L37E